MLKQILKTMSSYFHKSEANTLVLYLWNVIKTQAFFVLPSVIFSSSEQVLQTFTHPLNFTFGHKIQTFN